MNYAIAVLKGDGIGPEIIDASLIILNAIQSKYEISFTFKEGVIGAAAIDAVGNPYPDTTHELCIQSDAILFGAIGDPKYDNNPDATVRPEQGLLAMRKALGLYANIRPITIYPELKDASPLKNNRLDGVDLVTVRELTGGIYFGEPRGFSEDGTSAYDTCAYSNFEIERIAHQAFKMAEKRRGNVTLVDKANVLATSQLWRKTVKELHKKSYSQISLDFMFVDNCAMQLIQNPAQFDVILTENMFGDILSDASSVLSGSLGMLPSASLGDKTGLFEPIHGSYPQAAGQDRANPMAAILSTAMMLDYLTQKPDLGNIIREAVGKAIKENRTTEDLSGKLKLSEVTTYLCSIL